MIATRRAVALALMSLLSVALIAIPALGKAADNAEKGMNRGYTPTDGRSASPRSTNHQGSERNQSNPDGGGIDKPVPATQGTSDWDWNNGCGNDDDRDDDNNGWCGRKPNHDDSRVASSKLRAGSFSKQNVGAQKGSAAAVTTAVKSASGKGSAFVLGASFKAGSGGASGRVVGSNTDVLGSGGILTEVLGAGFDAAGLPMTGFGLAGAGLIGLSLALSGLATLRRANRR